MASPVEPFVKRTLIPWIEGHEYGFRVKVFQIIDTLTWYRAKDDQIPSLDLFAIEPALIGIALFIKGFMVSQPLNTLAQEMHSLEYLRPLEYPRLPFLAPASAMQRLNFPFAQPQGMNDQANHEIDSPFQSYDDAKRRGDHLQRLNNKMGVTAGVSDCNDFPSSEAAQRDCAKALVEAMIDFTDIEEKDNSYKVKRVQLLTIDELHVLSWKVLFAIKDAQDGNIFLPDRMGIKPAYTQYQDFASRYQAVLQALKRYKSIVHDLMDWHVGRRLAADPAKESGRKKTNMTTNKTKGELIKKGQELRDQQNAETEAEKAANAQLAAEAGARGDAPEAGAEVDAAVISEFVSQATMEDGSQALPISTNDDDPEKAFGEAWDEDQGGDAVKEE